MSPDVIRDRDADDEEPSFDIDDPELIAELEASIEEAERGDLIPWEDVLADLRQMRERRG
jgi:hypothetical protein